MKPRRRLLAAAMVGAALAPAAVCAAIVTSEADAAHDAGVARVLALRPEPWRAADVVLGNLLAWAPVGTRAARAALAGGLVASMATIALLQLARAACRGCVPTAQRDAPSASPTRRTPSSRAWPSFEVLPSAIGVLTAALSAAWQTEAAAVGGAVSGALFVVAPVAILASIASDPDSPEGIPPQGAVPGEGERKSAPGLWTAAAFVAALAIGHEPWCGACAFCGCGALVAASAPARRSLIAVLRVRPWPFGAAAAAGLAPCVVASWRMRLAAATTPASSPWSGETAPGAGGSLAAFLRTDVGVALLVLAAAGLAIATRHARARPIVAALATITLLGLAGAWIGAPVGPTRYGAPLLAAHGALGAMAAPALQAAVIVVSRARVPLARASAAMVVLLELVLPVDAADRSLDATAHAKTRAARAARAWNEVVWGTLPAGSVALLTDAAVVERAMAARAQDDLRRDVTVLPLCAGCPVPWLTLARDTALVAVWRDVELTGAPTEASLSTLAAARTLVTSFDPAWGAAVGRHLVPLTLLDRFTPEPRGASDRRQALDAFAPTRDRLAALTAFDGTLARASGALLRARANLYRTGADRNLAERAASDVRLFDTRAAP